MACGILVRPRGIKPTQPLHWMNEILTTVFIFLVKVLNENMVRVEILTDMWQTHLKSGKSPGEKSAAVVGFE